MRSPPKRTFRQIIIDFARAVAGADISVLKPFYNTVLGEPYWTGGELKHWNEVYALRRSYALGELPEGFLPTYVTMGVDVGEGYLALCDPRVGPTGRRRRAVRVVHARPR